MLPLGAVNPGHWTEDMRTDALEPAQLNDSSLKVMILPSFNHCTADVKYMTRQSCRTSMMLQNRRGVLLQQSR